MKRFLALFVTACMMAVLLAGCGGAASSAGGEPQTSTGGSESVAANVEAGNWKIGYLAASSADAGQALPTQESLKQAVEALGCTVVEVIPTSTSPDDLITAVENLINQGCDAICLYNQIHMQGLVATVIDMCEEAGVYVSFYNTLIDEGSDAWDAATESEYFVSAHYNDNEKAGYDAMAKLGELGCEKVCVFGLPVSNLTGTYRMAGAEAAAEDYGIEILSFVSDAAMFTPEGGATVAEGFLSSYPDVDGILLTGGSGLFMSGYSTVLEGKDIYTSCIDFFENQSSYFDNGVVSYVTGGHIAGGVYGVIMLVNKLNGTPLSDGPAFIEDKFLEANDAAQAADFVTCYFNGQIFTAEEVQNCCVAFNPEANMDTLMTFIDGYTVEGLMAKY